MTYQEALKYLRKVALVASNSPIRAANLPFDPQFTPSIEAAVRALQECLTYRRSVAALDWEA